MSSIGPNGPGPSFYDVCQTAAIVRRRLNERTPTHGISADGRQRRNSSDVRQFTTNDVAISGRRRVGRVCYELPILERRKSAVSDFRYRPVLTKFWVRLGNGVGTTPIIVSETGALDRPEFDRTNLFLLIISFPFLLSLYCLCIYVYLSYCFLCCISCAK